MEQESLFPTEVRLRRIDPEDNVWRFYALTIEHTLFGEWAVILSWGRIGTTGHRRLDIVSGPGEALDVIGRIRNAKIRRGYVLVWSR